MAFCEKCGAQVEQGARFCPSCGAAIGVAATPDGAPHAPEAAPGESVQNEWAEKLNKLNDTPDLSSEFTSEDIAKNKGMAVLAYLGPLVLVPIFAAKDSAYAKFHVNQGLSLLIVAAAWGLASNLATAILRAIWSWLGNLVGTVLDIVGLVFVVAMIVGILNAVNGKAKELPIIGKYRLLK